MFFKPRSSTNMARHFSENEMIKNQVDKKCSSRNDLELQIKFASLNFLHFLKEHSSSCEFEKKKKEK